MIMISRLLCVGAGASATIAFQLYRAGLTDPAFGAAAVGAILCSMVIDEVCR